ncbi:MAG: hypothetical protein ACI8QC_002055 [Planctomycetota bacterium]|jgi:hypothetical protein
MRSPAHRAHAASRIALAYGLDPVMATRALPEGMRAKLVRGKALGVVLITRFSKLRPRAWPVSIGISISTCAHAVLAQWEHAGVQRAGLCVLRSDVDSRWLGPARGLVLPGVTHSARFHIRDEGHEFEVGVHSVDGTLEVEAAGLCVPELPTSSLFRSQREAADLLGLCGGEFVTSPGPGKLEPHSLDAEGGAVSACDLGRVRASWFEDSGPFPAGCAEFDSALVVRDLACIWPVSQAPVGGYGRLTKIVSPTEISPA